MHKTSLLVGCLSLMLVTTAACRRSYSGSRSYPSTPAYSGTGQATAQPGSTGYGAQPSGGGYGGGAQAGNVVQIRNHAYQPATVSVRAGETVRWVNYDSVAHTVTCPQEPALDLQIGPNEERSYTFSTAGEFDYMCRIHPQMKGHVSVRAR